MDRKTKDTALLVDQHEEERSRSFAKKILVHFGRNLKRSAGDFFGGGSSYFLLLTEIFVLLFIVKEESSPSESSIWDFCDLVSSFSSSLNYLASAALSLSAAPRWTTEVNLFSKTIGITPTQTSRRCCVLCRTHFSSLFGCFSLCVSCCGHRAQTCTDRLRQHATK